MDDTRRRTQYEKTDLQATAAAVHAAGGVYGWGIGGKHDDA